MSDDVLLHSEAWDSSNLSSSDTDQSDHISDSQYPRNSGTAPNNFPSLPVCSNLALIVLQ